MRSAAHGDIAVDVMVDVVVLVAVALLGIDSRCRHDGQTVDVLVLRISRAVSSPVDRISACATMCHYVNTASQHDARVCPHPHHTPRANIGGFL